MKIIIKNSERLNMHIWLPSSLITSRMFSDTVKKHTDFTVDFSHTDLRAFRSVLRKFKREHKNFVFVDVKSKDGDEVKIIL